MKEDKELSCAYCNSKACDAKGKEYPEFCLTKNMREDRVAEIMKVYSEGSHGKIMIAAADVEYEGYLKLTRVEEIILFAEKIGAEKIGIATCVGLLSETRILREILEGRGFQVYGVACKVGAIPKTTVGIKEECTQIGETMCNPIMQAALLEEEGTELNIVMGLCVGHDSLFYKHSKAPATTLVTKDRVLGHNPVAALYTADTYYKKLKNR